MIEVFTNPEYLVALLTLTSLEIVLGIDNIVFISILCGKLHDEKQKAIARNVGLALAMIMRLGLLLSLSWIMKLTAPLFNFLSQEISGRDLILIVGGFFLLAKSTYEIHHKLEGEHGEANPKGAPSLKSIIIQILFLDLIFSLDSVITAVGMVDQISIMITAVIISVGVMLLSAKAISDYVNAHPTLKILALSFLLLIGFSLVAEGFEQHISKGYIYFAMGFSIFVEMINLRISKKKKTKPVELREHIS